MTPAGPPSTSIRYERLQTIVFLLVLPALNTAVAGSILFNLDLRGPGVALNAGLRIWATFAASLVLLRLSRAHFPSSLKDDAFWRQLLVHAVIVIGMGYLFGPFIAVPESLPRPRVSFAPRIVVCLELATYLVVVRILKEQERWFATTAALRDAELDVMRSRSNPHFLFNTLNLIASEVSRDPENAKEIIFDLADLLRASVKAADRSLSSIAEEMGLVRLYLQLHTQRFRDRLTFSMDIGPGTPSLEIPSLLLQPVVENTVKWAVAPHTSKAHVRVRCELQDAEICIVFQDSGPPFDDRQIDEGNGFQILRRTLELHYPDRWTCSLRSTAEGGRLELRFPAREYVRP